MTSASQGTDRAEFPGQGGDEVIAEVSVDQFGEAALGAHPMAAQAPVPPQRQRP